MILQCGIVLENSIELYLNPQILVEKEIDKNFFGSSN